MERINRSQASTELKKTTKALILTHENPDGDTLGSASALYSAITAEGGQAVVCATDAPQDFYDFLPGFKDIKQTTQELAENLVSEGYRLIIVDAPSPERVGLSKVPENSDTLVIDHHPSRDDFEAKAIIEPHASATAELIYHLLKAAKFTITHDIMSGIFAGIVTDTGNFKYPNVTADTMKVVAEMIKNGLDISKLSSLIYERTNLANRKLLGRTMERLFSAFDGKLAISAITWSDMIEFSAQHRDTDFIIDEVRKLGGPEVYILAKEIKPDQFRISMRGRGKIDLNKIAQTYGGGGHHDAAGFTITGDWLNVRGALLQLFEPLME